VAGNIQALLRAVRRQTQNASTSMADSYGVSLLMNTLTVYSARTIVDRQGIHVVLQVPVSLLLVSPQQLTFDVESAASCRPLAIVGRGDVY
jgi:hypothetical protein